MNKKYIYILFLIISSFAFSQENKKNEIEGLTIYPNPNNTGKLFITSKLNEDKKIEVFDVLGKKMLDATVTTKELNISNLNPGIYIIKISENENRVSRKLIVN